MSQSKGSLELTSPRASDLNRVHADVVTRHTEDLDEVVGVEEVVIVEHHVLGPEPHNTPQHGSTLSWLVHGCVCCTQAPPPETSSRQELAIESPETEYVSICFPEKSGSTFTEETTPGHVNTTFNDEHRQTFGKPGCVSILHSPPARLPVSCEVLPPNENVPSSGKLYHRAHLDFADLEGTLVLPEDTINSACETSQPRKTVIGSYQAAQIDREPSDCVAIDPPDLSEEVAAGRERCVGHTEYTGSTRAEMTGYRIGEMSKTDEMTGYPCNEATEDDNPRIRAYASGFTKLEESMEYCRQQRSTTPRCVDPELVAPNEGPYPEDTVDSAFQRPYYSTLASSDPNFPHLNKAIVLPEETAEPGYEIPQSGDTCATYTDGGQHDSGFAETPSRNRLDKACTSDLGTLADDTTISYDAPVHKLSIHSVAYGEWRLEFTSKDNFIELSLAFIRASGVDLRCQGKLLRRMDWMISGNRVQDSVELLALL